ncbi:hypothetical protein LG298_05330 [Cytobacillus firmus]|uniref:hypothetical protein n=1 Tax=Cytobacillus firmus TaxID=1399 RepID=UPI00384F4E40
MFAYVKIDPEERVYFMQILKFSCFTGRYWRFTGHFKEDTGQSTLFTGRIKGFTGQT